MFIQKILMVDDQESNLIALETLLEHPSRELVRATSGNEALAALLKDDFALVLLDVQMPEMDGFEVAQLMRSHKRTETVPIIFLTAISKEQQYVFKGYESGAVDYLFKPLEPPVLRAKVNFFLELDLKHRQLDRSLREIRQLKDSNEILLKSVGEGILGLEPDGTISYVNPAACHALSLHKSSLVGKPVSQFLKLDEDSLENWQASHLYADLKEGRITYRDKGALIQVDERTFPIEFTASPVMDGRRLSGAVITFQDITQRRAFEEKLTRLAEYDSLTGLANRHLFSNILSGALSRAQRAGHPLALLFIDLDRFKHVNDGLGHDVGDLLLKAVAKRLLACTRKADTVCRLGGDEFVILLETLEHSRDSAVVASKINQELGRVFEIKGHEIHIGASIGIVTWPETAGDEQELLKCADMAMYAAKEKGRNNFQFFTASMREEVERVHRIENDLHQAIANNEFEIYYQPVIDLSSGQVSSIEALLRWHHEEKLMMPGEFIPIAEGSGLIREIGSWVLEHACRQIQQWHERDLTHAPVVVSVNLSVRQLHGKDVLNVVHALMRDLKVPPEQLVLEITESMIMEEPELLMNIIEQINQLGIRIALDDFGSGYSSFAQLRKIPASIIKIDQEFIAHIERNDRDRAIVGAMISMAHHLGMEVIAEGVETEGQQQALELLGCDQAQGFLLAHPMPAGELEEFLARYPAHDIS